MPIDKAERERRRKLVRAHLAAETRVGEEELVRSYPITPFEDLLR